MTTEREFHRSHATLRAVHLDEDVAPNRTTKSSLLNAPTHPEASGLVMRKARDANGVEAGAGDLVAAAASSGGTALPTTLMRKFESSLGADLSSVRVHTDSASAAAAAAVGARAYTVDQDIHFAAGQYDPSSSTGEHLLAHEVAHTVQQRGGTPTRQNKLEVSSPHDAAEHEADCAADAMVSGQSFAVASNGGVQRQVFREPDGYSGPSYARKGPPGSTIDDRRQATMGSAAYAAEYDNTCLDAASKIVKGAQTLYSVASKIETNAKAKGLFSDKDLIELAKQVRDIAKALQGMKQGWDTLKAKKFDFSKSQLAQEPELPKVLDVLKASKNSILQAYETTEALSSFQNDPSRETAKAWADSVAKQFAAAKSIVGALPFPPGCDFMKQYFEGLLGAPAAYIAAFQAIVDKRYQDLDKEAGIPNSDSSLTESGTTVWKGGGPVQNMVHMSYTAPGPPNRLYEWFKRHTKIQGVDMESNPPLDRAKALFILELTRDESVAEFRDVWVTWIRAFGGTTLQPTALTTAPDPSQQEGEEGVAGDVDADVEVAEAVEDSDSGSDSDEEYDA